MGSIVSDDPEDPRPFLIPGVRAQFAKITRSMKRRAKRAAAGLIGEVGEGATRDLLDLADAGEAFSEALIRAGLLDWEGIGYSLEQPMPVTPETIEMFLADERLFDAVDREYVLPEVLWEAEKNGLSVSPSGIGEAATPASDTVISPVAGTIDAPNAPTASKNRTRRKARKSGS